jgi:predicted RNA-binding protein YlxR (DUF448 family)
VTTNGEKGKNVQTVTEERNPQKPTRTCAGCARHEDADAMVRLVRGPGGEIAVDAGGSSFGRGAHVHARPECIAKACKGGLARSFKSSVVADAATLATQIVEAVDRRIVGLLGAAKRSGALAVGADASCDALEGANKQVIVVVASDAGTVVGRDPIADAIASGRAVAWKDKATLGALVGRGEVAVCVVLEGGIATELSKARAMADAVSK